MYRMFFKRKKSMLRKFREWLKHYRRVLLVVDISVKINIFI